MLEKLHENQFLMIPFLISVVISAVIGISVGFVATYKLVSFIGT